MKVAYASFKIHLSLENLAMQSKLGTPAVLYWFSKFGRLVSGAMVELNMHMRCCISFIILQMCGERKFGKSPKGLNVVELTELIYISQKYIAKKLACESYWETKFISRA